MVAAEGGTTVTPSVVSAGNTSLPCVLALRLTAHDLGQFGQPRAKAIPVAPRSGQEALLRQRSGQPVAGGSAQTHLLGKLGKRHRAFGDCVQYLERSQR